MKLNKNELNGKWFKADKETFDALVEAGYKAHLNTRREDKGFFVTHELDGCADVFHTVGLEFDTEGKQAYHHNGEFYTIDGEWLEEKELTYGETQNTEKKSLLPLIVEIDGEYAPDKGIELVNGQYFEILGLDEGKYKLQIRRNDIETDAVIDALNELGRPKNYIGVGTVFHKKSEPFPAFEDIEWVMVEVPEWYPFANVDEYSGKHSAQYFQKEAYLEFKVLYENSKDFTVTWKLKEKQCPVCNSPMGNMTFKTESMDCAVCSETCIIRAQYADQEPTAKQEGGSHYTDLAIQPMEYSEKNNLTATEHTVIKYVTRHRFKNGLEDIKKAKHTLELLAYLQYGEKI